MLIIIIKTRIQRLYLIASLQSLLTKRETTSASLSSAHIRILLNTPSSNTSGSSTTNSAVITAAAPDVKILNFARKYTARIPESAAVWLARLEAEKRINPSVENIEKAWAEARKCVAEDATGDVQLVWMWGLSDSDVYSDDPDARRKIHEVGSSYSFIDHDVDTYAFHNFATDTPPRKHARFIKE